MKKKCKNAKAQIKGSAGGHLYSSSYVAEKLWNTSLEETGQLVFKFKQRASHWPSADPAFKTCLHLSGQSSQDTQTVKDNSTEGQTLWLIKHFCQNTIRWKKPCGLNCVMFTMLDYASKNDFPIELKSIFNFSFSPRKEPVHDRTLEAHLKSWDNVNHVRRFSLGYESHNIWLMFGLLKGNKDRRARRWYGQNVFPSKHYWERSIAAWECDFDKIPQYSSIRLWDM